MALTSDEQVQLRAQKKERLDSLRAQNRELMEKSGGEAINADLRETFRANMEEADQLAAEVRALDGTVDAQPIKDIPEVMEELGNPKAEDNPFVRWAVDGGKGDTLTPEERTRCISADGRFRGEALLELDIKRRMTRLKVAERMGIIKPAEAAEERVELLRMVDTQRAFITPADGSGVPTITPGFVTYRLKSIKGVRPICTSYATPTGVNMEFPLYDDIEREGEYLAEGTTSNSADDDGETMTHADLRAYTLSSRPFPFGRLLMMNAAYDVVALVRAQLNRSIAFRENKWLSSGTGTNQPTGYQTLAGKAFETGAATAITFRELVEMVHSIDPAYRDAEGEGVSGVDNMYGRKGACWVMHDTVWGYIRGLEDADKRQLWETSYKVGNPMMLLGYPVQIDQHAPALGTTRRPATGQKLIHFGDFSYMVIRDSGAGHFDVVADGDRVYKDQIAFNRIVYIDANTISPRVTSSTLGTNKVECYKFLEQG